MFPQILFPGKVDLLVGCITMSDLVILLSIRVYFADTLVCRKSISFPGWMKFGFFVLIVETAIAMACGISVDGAGWLHISAACLAGLFPEPKQRRNLLLLAILTDFHHLTLFSLSSKVAGECSIRETEWWKPDVGGPGTQRRREHNNKEGVRPFLPTAPIPSAACGSSCSSFSRRPSKRYWFDSHWEASRSLYPSPNWRGMVPLPLLTGYGICWRSQLSLRRKSTEWLVVILTRLCGSVNSPLSNRPGGKSQYPISRGGKHMGAVPSLFLLLRLAAL